MRVASLSCGHTAEVSEWCDVGSVTACPECVSDDEDAPGVNRTIVVVHEDLDDDDIFS